MIPDEPDASRPPGTPVPSPSAAAPPVLPASPVAEPGDTAREIDELTFLVGTSCSRTITLLMQSDAERGALYEELVFLADKAGRLAALLG